MKKHKVLIIAPLLLSFSGASTANGYCDSPAANYDSGIFDEIENFASSMFSTNDTNTSGVSSASRALNSIERNAAQLYVPPPVVVEDRTNYTSSALEKQQYFKDDNLQQEYEKTLNNLQGELSGMGVSVQGSPSVMNGKPEPTKPSSSRKTRCPNGGFPRTGPQGDYCGAPN